MDSCAKVNGAHKWVLRDLQELIKSMRSELSEVKTRSIECKKKKSTLNKELKETKKQIIELKQYSRKENIQLKGISQVPD